MAIQRWDPLKELVALQRRMNDLFEDTLAQSAGGDGIRALSATGWAPPVDLHEGPESYVLRADLPGVSPEDVKLEVQGGTLTLRGERKMDEGVSREAYLRVERPYGPFAVQIALPNSVEPSGIRAKHKSGVIEVTLPRKQEERKSPIAIAVEEQD